MNSGSLLVRCHEARKPEIAIHARGAINKESDARIAALKLVVGDLNHLPAVDVDRYDVSNHRGLHRVTILNPILRTSDLLQVGELSQRPFRPGDIAIGLGSFGASEHDFVPRAIVGRNGTSQSQLHFLPDLTVLVLIRRANCALDRLARPPSTFQQSRGIIAFLRLRSTPADFGPKGKAWTGADVGPIKAVRLAVVPFAAFRDGILSAGKVGAVGPVQSGWGESGRQHLRASRRQGPEPQYDGQQDRR